MVDYQDEPKPDLPKLGGVPAPNERAYKLVRGERKEKEIPAPKIPGKLKQS